jgi:chromosome segregation ATPase
VSVELSVPLKSLEQPLRESIRELRRGYQSVSECLEQTMAECDVRGAELADCRRQLAESRRSLSECERQLAERTRADADLVHRYANLKKQLEAKQAELTQTCEKFQQAQTETAQDKQRLQLQIESAQQLNEQIERIKAQHDASLAELSQLRSQFAPLAESAAETLQLRGEVTLAQSELGRLREQLAKQRPDEGLAEQLAAEQSQRQQLEMELEALRHRGAELAEALGEQKRLLTSEREHWSEELRQMRRAVEKQAEVLAQRPAAATVTDAPAQPAPRPANQSQAAANVIGSVLEQFEMLQKNKVRKLASSSG